MSPNVRAARSNWHVNYDHPREQAGQVVQGSQAGATSTADEVMADDQENDDEQEEGDELEDDDEELENEDEGGDEANSSGEESVDDPDAVGFSDKLRAFLQPNFSAEQTGAGQATYALPGGEDDDDEGGDEEDVEEDPEEHIRKKAKKGRKESTRWAHLTDRRRKGVGVHRGPRKAAPMTPEISMRMSEATDAMIKQNFNTAATIALEVIRINAETHQAWTLLAAIWQEVGEKTNAAKCLVFAAHLRPKLVSAWTSAAEYCLDETGSEGILFLETALACYSAAARAEPTNVEARLGQAHVCVLLGKNLSAGIAFVKALKSQRANLGILRQLAVVCLDAEDPTMAIEEYEKTIKYLKKQPDEKSTDFSWEDLDTYIVLLEDIGEWANAIHEIKSVSRWLNGRERQNFWDQVTENDCEWDADDSRRKEIPEFAEGGAKITADSLLMPLEIRVKLGMNRLMLGQLEEAMVSARYAGEKSS